MSPFRYRDEESSSTGTIIGVVAGALAGFAVGMFVAQRVGGFSGLKTKLRERSHALNPQALRDRYAAAVSDEDVEFQEYEDDDFENEDYDD